MPSASNIGQGAHPDAPARHPRRRPPHAQPGCHEDGPSRPWSSGLNRRDHGRALPSCRGSYLPPSRSAQRRRFSLLPLQRRPKPHASRRQLVPAAVHRTEFYQPLPSNRRCDACSARRCQKLGVPSEWSLAQRGLPALHPTGKLIDGAASAADGGRAR